MAFLWTELERSPKEVQEAHFRENVDSEPIQSFSDIKKGDHITFKTSISDSYYHHCLCIGHNKEGNPTVIHYYGTPSEALSAISGTSGKSFGAAAKVQRMQLPNKGALKDEADFEKKDARRIIWSPDMRRYSVEETIKRALTREGKPYYDLVKNNCEHFVMWCMCNIHTSLQIKSKHFAWREAFLAVKNGILNTAKTQFSKIAVEGIVNAIDDAALAVAKFATKEVRGLTALGVGLSLGFGALVETVVAGYEIHQKYKQWRDGVLIQSREDFAQSVSEIVTAGVCRYGLGFCGFVIGQICIPIPVLGALIGSFVGVGLGNIIGNFFGPYVGKGLLWLTEKVKNLFG